MSKYLRQDSRIDRSNLEKIKAILMQLKKPNAHQLAALKSISAKLSGVK